MILLLASAALAGYGDAINGLPSPAERELHLWTNAVRVDPEAFKADYPCSFDAFQDFEKTPKMPLLWHYDLNDAARFHTDDMQETGNFSHTSSDGTSFGARLDRFYESGFVGENIAWGYTTPWSAQVEGWMCSSGHRANLMSPDYEELGTGVAGVYYTQDFGSRGADIAAHPIRMGAHTPFQVLTEVTFLADFFDAFHGAPSEFAVIVNGDPIPMALTYGTPAQGVYTADLTIDAGPCYQYWFRAVRGDGRITTFPEEGAYGLGGCAYEDADAKWLLRDPDAGGIAGDTGTLREWDDGDLRSWRRWPFGGCSTTGSSAAFWPLALLPLALRRRRS
ncbi:MAG: hypothetical protein ACI8PZ_005591 [Myxococcota bacterium]|jgi:uncharacterized protein (TIGR03382 family)